MDDKTRIVMTENSEIMPELGAASKIPVSIDIGALLKDAFNCYQNVEMSREEQITLRTEIREKAKICIAMIEADTSRFEMQLNEMRIERMKYIDTICEIMRKEKVDNTIFELCKEILNYLVITNPMNRIMQATFWNFPII